MVHIYKKKWNIHMNFLRMLLILDIYTLYGFLAFKTKSPKNYVLVEKSLYILTGRTFIKMYHCGWRLCTALLPLTDYEHPMKA